MNARMRTRVGYSIVSGPDGTIKEDTFTCVHCNNVVFIKKNASLAEMGGVCRLCMDHVCPACDAKGTCDPFEKKLERMEARDRLIRSAMS